MEMHGRWKNLVKHPKRKTHVQDIPLVITLHTVTTNQYNALRDKNFIKRHDNGTAMVGSSEQKKKQEEQTKQQTHQTHLTQAKTLRNAKQRNT
ncbi:hypothetical protein C922_03610 [Plasmodium inui San Antonio 1]|uniref:Uncharacterized protein n=1 Tax=Plasmodium inui San Antonio 1 TaxID=1237626 RepID=W7AKL9_9APIC|nr:hypothetical protein C922_03610 [Plasmodium inui San Antonio 1]EUD65886.1 hypothetical protein C922_03610 [Plasmodium inui San Antonio 1]